MNKSLLMELYRDYHRYFTPLSQELKKEGFSLNESLILLALFFENGREVTPSDLSKTLSIPKDQISQALKKLESQNLIERENLKRDARKKSIQLAPRNRNRMIRLVEHFESSERVFETQSPRH